MKTRKILTMTYRDHATTINGEKCDGDCYAYDATLKANDASWDMSTLVAACGALLGTHARICGNAGLRVGISLDESRGVYIGSFYHFGEEEIVAGGTLIECVEEIGRVTRAFTESAEGVAALRAHPGKGRDACAYGEDKALVAFMVAAAGVPLADRAGVAAAIACGTDERRVSAMWDDATIRA